LILLLVDGEDFVSSAVKEFSAPGISLGGPVGPVDALACGSSLVPDEFGEMLLNGELDECSEAGILASANATHGRSVKVALKVEAPA
jgi:hypothetical protein